MKIFYIMCSPLIYHIFLICLNPDRRHQVAGLKKDIFADHKLEAMQQPIYDVWECDVQGGESETSFTSHSLWNRAEVRTPEISLFRPLDISIPLYLFLCIDVRIFRDLRISCLCALKYTKDDHSIYYYEKNQLVRDFHTWDYMHVLLVWRKWQIDIFLFYLFTLTTIKK